MSTTQSDPSIGSLLNDLVADVTGLFRKEIQLAKVEASEKVDNVVQASQGLVVGGILAIGAVGVFLTALVTGGTALLTAMGMNPILSSFLSALVIAIVVGLIAWSMISGGLTALKAQNFNMNRTARSLARDAEAVKETL